ncbi:putative protocadherin beta-18 isoform X2 [Mercenaria mercenaria]|uniref:putative protocadherin beta-18 isoform X2 n=1 Tax=Mercenaria mercenaria TaxID=6596 RepID=UPI00234F5DE1|nr:putative protocadherin beta-18 isoform X2 [Mercenaria mercenaria]
MMSNCLLYLFFFGIVLKSVKGIVTITFETEEEITGNVFLGNIAAKLGANETEIFGGNLEGANYNILKSGDVDYSDYFDFNSATSDFYLKQKVDREEVCQQSEVCKMRVILFGNSGTVTEFVNINVTVKDINDNIPTFSESVKNLYIQEGTAIRTSYTLTPAIDLDSGINAIQEYILEPSRTDFELEKQQNLDGSSTLNLILNLSLDRESTHNYTLYVKAVDGGTPPFTGTLTVNINVTDKNDNRPIFQPAEYNATIDEDVEIDTVVITVSAIDRDIGENSRLAYYFADSVTSDIRQYFGIKETSGNIFVKEMLDSASRPFIFFIEVKDHGDPMKKSQAKVTINIRDKNNNRPVIEMSPSSNINIKENLNIGTHVALVIVSDEDSGLNGEADCECLNSSFTIMKASEVAQNTFSLVSAVEFDRELQAFYTVEINCSDKGQPPLSSNHTFIVTITDENDHTPIFAKTIYTVDILENISVGAVFEKVQATDRDIDQNGKIVYEIEPFAESSMFEIDPDGGHIKAAERFDRETEDEYYFIVTARDQGPNKRSATAQVIVHVKDVNDNSPAFIGDSYAMSILENSNISYSLGTVTATDADLDDNGKVSYMIPAKYAMFPFAILDDGTVITTEGLDREVRDYYHFNVVASDHGNPPRTSSVPVFVTVLDQNDNAPIVEFPYGDNDTVTVAHDTGPDIVIASVLADDNDDKENKRLSYSIRSGDSEGLFHIDSETGEIYLTKRISRGDIKRFTLTLSIKDNGVKPLETHATLHVTFYLADTDTVADAAVGSKGQNILIAIVISCVTFVLSVIIIVIICMIRRKDSKNSLYNAKAYDEQKIMEGHRNSNRSSSSRGSQDKMLYPSEKAYMENGYAKKAKKEVSFIVEEDQDTGVSMETNGQFDSVSTFTGKSPSPVPSKSPDYENYNQEISPPRSEKSEDKQREIHRMTSLRVHQALIQSQNNNNNNKQWPQSPGDEEGYWTFPRRTMSTKASVSSTYISDESRSPNMSTSHPFYTSDNRQPTFSSFHGNNVHKTGPILSSFLKQNKKTAK